MIRILQSLAGYVRREPRTTGDGIAAVLDGEDALQSGGALLRRKRAKVAAFAILFGLLSGLVDLPLPAEDFYRAIRAELRSRPAPQDIAMIAIDDKTIKGVEEGSYPSRIEDSQLIDVLIATGVSEVAFDRAHADPKARKPMRASQRLWRGTKARFGLGFAPRQKLGFQVVEEIVPRPEFRAACQPCSHEWVGQSVRPVGYLSDQVELDGVTHPSLSAVLADYTWACSSVSPGLCIRSENHPDF